MLHEHLVLQQNLKSTADKPAGSLTIGAVPTAMPIAARFAAMLQAQHPGILPVVLSLSSSELETRLDNLSIDLGLGYTERMDTSVGKLKAMPQYVEHYFLLRRAAVPHAVEMQVSAPMTWQEAAGHALCLLTPDMHNRTIVNAAFASVGCRVQASIETNSILTMALSVVAGQVCSVMPGALVAAVRGYRELEALPLESPQVLTPIGFMSHAQVRPSRAMAAAQALAQDGVWLRHAATYSGLLLPF
jgi:DNA-binding transcriptional LysR family regulator